MKLNLKQYSIVAKNNKNCHNNVLKPKKSKKTSIMQSVTSAAATHSLAPAFSALSLNETHEELHENGLDPQKRFLSLLYATRKIGNAQCSLQTLIGHIFSLLKPICERGHYGIQSSNFYEVPPSLEDFYEDVEQLIDELCHIRPKCSMPQVPNISCKVCMYYGGNCTDFQGLLSTLYKDLCKFYGEPSLVKDHNSINFWTNAGDVRVYFQSASGSQNDKLVLPFELFYPSQKPQEQADYLSTLSPFQDPMQNLWYRCQKARRLGCEDASRILLEGTSFSKKPSIWRDACQLLRDNPTHLNHALSVLALLCPTLFQVHASHIRCPALDLEFEADFARAIGAFSEQDFQFVDVFESATERLFDVKDIQVQNYWQRLLALLACDVPDLIAPVFKDFVQQVRESKNPKLLFCGMQQLLTYYHEPIPEWLQNASTKDIEYNWAELLSRSMRFSYLVEQSCLKRKPKPENHHNGHAAQSSSQIASPKVTTQTRKPNGHAKPAAQSSAKVSSKLLSLQEQVDALLLKPKSENYIFELLARHPEASEEPWFRAFQFFQDKLDSEALMKGVRVLERIKLQDSVHEHLCSYIYERPIFFSHRDSFCLITNTSRRSSVETTLALVSVLEKHTDLCDKHIGKLYNWFERCSGEKETVALRLFAVATQCRIPDAFNISCKLLPNILPKLGDINDISPFQRFFEAAKKSPKAAEAHLIQICGKIAHCKHPKLSIEAVKSLYDINTLSVKKALAPLLQECIMLEKEQKLKTPVHALAKALSNTPQAILLFTPFFISKESDPSKQTPGNVFSLPKLKDAWPELCAALPAYDGVAKCCLDSKQYITEALNVHTALFLHARQHGMCTNPNQMWMDLFLAHLEQYNWSNETVNFFRHYLYHQLSCSLTEFYSMPFIDQRFDFKPYLTSIKYSYQDQEERICTPFPVYRRLGPRELPQEIKFYNALSHLITSCLLQLKKKPTSAILLDFVVQNLRNWIELRAQDPRLENHINNFVMAIRPGHALFQMHQKIAYTLLRQAVHHKTVVMCEKWKTHLQLATFDLTQYTEELDVIMSLLDSFDYTKDQDEIERSIQIIMLQFSNWQERQCLYADKKRDLCLEKLFSALRRMGPAIEEENIQNLARSILAPNIRILGSESEFGIRSLTHTINCLMEIRNVRLKEFNKAAAIIQESSLEREFIEEASLPVSSADSVATDFLEAAVDRNLFDQHFESFIVLAEKLILALAADAEIPIESSIFERFTLLLGRACSDRDSFDNQLALTKEWIVAIGKKESRNRSLIIYKMARGFHESEMIKKVHEENYPYLIDILIVFASIGNHLTEDLLRKLTIQFSQISFLKLQTKKAEACVASLPEIFRRQIDKEVPDLPKR